MQHVLHLSLKEGCMLKLVCFQAKLAEDTESRNERFCHFSSLSNGFLVIPGLPAKAIACKRRMFGWFLSLAITRPAN